MVAINYAKDVRVGEQPVKAAALGSNFVWPTLPERLFLRGQSKVYDFVGQKYAARLPDNTIDYTTNINDLGILTRASTGTYWGPSGTLLEAAVDEARIQHDPVTGKALGLLVESEATNDFPGGLFGSAASDDPAIITTVEDEKLPGVQVTRIEGADDDFEGFRNYRTISTVPSSMASAGLRRLTVLVKPSGPVRYMRVATWSNTHTTNHSYTASVDLWELQTNRSSRHYSDFYLQDVGDGWVFVSFTSLAHTSYLWLSVAFGMDGQGATAYANWTPIPAGEEVLLAIPQHYADTTKHVKTFIPTIDSPVTRAADDASIDLSDVLNPVEGTLRITAQVPEGEVVASMGDRHVISDSDEFKEYELNYIFHSGNTVAQLGEGIFNKVEYFPSMQGESDLADLIRTLYGNGEQGAMFIPEPKVLGYQVLYQDAAGTVPVESDGDPVGLMLDLSGNGNHASQPTSAARPIYRTDGTLYWLEFDGVDDFMDMSVTAREVFFGVSAKVLPGSGSSTRVIISSGATNYFAYNGSSFYLFNNEAELGTSVRTPNNSIEVDVGFSATHRIEDTYTDITLSGETYSFNKSSPAVGRTYQCLGAFSSTSTTPSKIAIYSTIIVDGPVADSDRDRVIDYGNDLAGIQL